MEYLRIALRTHAPVSGPLILEVGFRFPDREGDAGLALLSELKGLQGFFVSRFRFLCLTNLEQTVCDKQTGQSYISVRPRVSCCWVPHNHQLQ